MHKILSIITIISMLAVSPLVHADNARSDSGDYAGIWQDQGNLSHYYAVNYNATAKTFILIDLSGIETTRDTLQSSYSGTITTVLSPAGISLLSNLSSFRNNKIGFRVQFNPDYTGSLTPICGETASCIANIILKKVF